MRKLDAVAAYFDRPLEVTDAGHEDMQAGQQRELALLISQRLRKTQPVLNCFCGLRHRSRA